MIIALKDDHVAAWKNAYAGRGSFGGPTPFLPGGSGHVAGMINPASANKHGYWVNDTAPDDADAWLAEAEQKSGSWRLERQGWLDAAGGDRRPAGYSAQGRFGQAERPGEAAPGSYVRVRHRGR